MENASMEQMNDLLENIKSQTVTIQESDLALSLLDDNAALLDDSNNSIETFKVFVREHLRETNKTYQSLLNTLTTLKEYNRIIIDLTLDINSANDIIRRMDKKERIQRLKYISERGIQTQVILIGLVYTNEEIVNDTVSIDYKIYKELIKVIRQLSCYQSLFIFADTFIDQYQKEHDTIDIDDEQIEQGGGVSDGQ